MIRILNFLFGYVRRQKLVMMHTTLNRITGLLLFLFPFFVKYGDSLCLPFFSAYQPRLPRFRKVFSFGLREKRENLPSKKGRLLFGFPKNRRPFLL